MTEPENRIAALFRAAADTAAPAPGFDHDAVVARSRRVTARRRSALLGGATALLVVAGIGVAALPRGAESPTSAAAPAAGSAAEEAAPERSADDAAAAPFGASENATPPSPAEGSSALGGAAPLTAAPLGPGTTPCVDRQDPQLRALVEQVLPEVVGAPEAGVTMECRPGGGRGVALEVDDAGTIGLLTVDYLPSGEAPDGPDGLSATTASGGTVVVRSQGRGGLVPFEGRLDTLVAFLAERL